MTDPTEAAESASALDLLLSDAALGTLRRFRPDSSMIRFGLSLARRPRTVAPGAVTAGVQAARIAAGRSDLAPAARDRRFADPAWESNPFLKRFVQLHLTGA